MARPRKASNAPRAVRVAGLMSGTSADGIDAAFVAIAPGGVQLLAFETFPYPPAVRGAVLRLCDAATARIDELCHLNFLLGELFADAVIALARKSGIPLASIDLIGSHGQTIHHLPHGRRACGRLIRSTLQIGEPSVIAERTGITTVADFRPRDIAAGGEGAPLVPHTDYVLFHAPRCNRAVQNIGGIANVTWLPRRGGPGSICAFDTGPGNMVLDRLAAMLTRGRLRCDRDGRMARRGKVHEALLAELLSHPFLTHRPPKSTGRETFGAAFTDALHRRAARMGIAPCDLMATATAFTARSIAEAYRRFLPARPEETILCGGGARNPALVAAIREAVAPTRVRIMDELGINADAKEAVSFAILAYETFHQRPGNVPSATGAQRRVVLGKIVPGFQG